MITAWCKLKVRSQGGDSCQKFCAMIFISVLLGLIDVSDIVMLGSGPNSCCQQNLQGWTGMYTLVVPSLSMKFIKNSHQNLPI